MATRRQRNQARRRTRRYKQRGGARVEDWTRKLMEHPAYRKQKDPAFEQLTYEFAALKESLKTAGLTIEPHDVQGGGEDDDISRLNPNSGFETPSYLYDVGTTLAFLIGPVLNEQGATPAKFAEIINAMKQPSQISDIAASLDYMTQAENIMRSIARLATSDDILSKKEEYPLLIWAVVMTLKPDANNAIPEPTVPALITGQPAPTAEPLT